MLTDTKIRRLYRHEPRLHGFFLQPRYDTNTPLKETLQAMVDIVRLDKDALPRRIGLDSESKGVTNVLVGVSSTTQIEKNMKCVHVSAF